MAINGESWKFHISLWEQRIMELKSSEDKDLLSGRTALPIPALRAVEEPALLGLTGADKYRREMLRPGYSTREFQDACAKIYERTNQFVPSIYSSAAYYPPQDPRRRFAEEQINGYLWQIRDRL